MGKTAVVILVALLLIGGFATGIARAEGGAYLDDFRISNDGTEVFFDNFNDGSIADWTKMHDTTVVRDDKDKLVGYMFMNKHTHAASTAWHPLSVSSAGLVELSTLVYVTPYEQQFDIRDGYPSVLMITLYSGSSDATAGLYIYLDKPKQDSQKSACSICVNLKNPNGTTIIHNTALVPQKWATLTLRLDPKTGIASALLDGTVVRTLKYDPAKFKSIRELGLCCSFGDGAAHVN